MKILGSGITLNSVVSADSAVVRAGESELAQVVLNLVLNARDALPNGGVIKIQTRIVTLGDRDVPRDCDAGDFVELSVSDDGCGMSPETRERIFEPFFTTKGPGKGTGLGLSIAYSDISRNGGFLTVDSHEGTGTVVSVFLPQSADSAIEATAETPGPATEFIGGDETILVCDDEDIVLSSVRALLESVGYSVIAVKTAADALAAADSRDLDISLLLTDVAMPGMNGFELGREIHKWHPHMRILHSSGYNTDDFATGEGDDIVYKGDSSSKLLQRVRQLLDGTV